MFREADGIPRRPRTGPDCGVCTGRASLRVVGESRAGADRGQHGAMKPDGSCAILACWTLAVGSIHTEPDPSATCGGQAAGTVMR